MMLKCWAEHADERPTFTDIVRDLKMQGSSLALVAAVRASEQIGMLPPAGG